MTLSVSEGSTTNFNILGNSPAALQQQLQASPSFAALILNDANERLSSATAVFPTRLSVSNGLRMRAIRMAHDLVVANALNAAVFKKSGLVQQLLNRVDEACGCGGVNNDVSAIDHVTSATGSKEH